MYAEAPVAALICMGDENSVRFCDAAKNVFGSEYHVREARCQPQQLPFSQVAQHLSQWISKCIFLRVRTCLPLAHTHIYVCVCVCVCVIYIFVST